LRKNDYKISQVRLRFIVGLLLCLIILVLSSLFLFATTLTKASCRELVTVVFVVYRRDVQQEFSDVDGACSHRHVV